MCDGVTVETCIQRQAWSGGRQQGEEKHAAHTANARPTQLVNNWRDLSRYGQSSLDGHWLMSQLSWLRRADEPSLPMRTSSAS
jgi:hypothetical protein